MRRFPVLIWAGRAVAVATALLFLLGIIPPGGPAALSLLSLSVALVLVGGGRRI